MTVELLSFKPVEFFYIAPPTFTVKLNNMVYTYNADILHDRKGRKKTNLSKYNEVN